MTERLPDPPVPADCDLRDVPVMPLDVNLLRDSRLAALAPPDGFRAAVLLWCASWHQIPAGSLPDDDTELAWLAGVGRAKFKRIRQWALHGWTKHSDGKLYHPVISEKANEAFLKKLEHKWRAECAKIRKHNERHGTKLETPNFKNFLEIRRWNAASRPIVTRDIDGRHKDVTRTSQGRRADVTPTKRGSNSPAVAIAPAPLVETLEDSMQDRCRLTWQAYSEAYRSRYGVDPVRNAKVNSQIKQLVQRIGDDAPEVAAWYVSHPGAYYVSRGHGLGALLMDAEKLRTEHATGRIITAGKAKQSDRAGTTMAAVAEILADMENGL